MGIFASCCGGLPPEDEDTNGYNQMGSKPSSSSQPVDRERLRELQAEAAERRLKENQTKGIKNVDSVMRQQAKRDQLENLQTNQLSSSQGGGGLKWQVG